MLNYQSYSKMLNIQVNMCFPFEQVFFDNIGLHNMQNIAEVGCGNGCFLNILSQNYPDSRFYGFDINEELIKIAVSEHNKLNFQVGTVDSINSNYDLLILRLIMHQLENRKKFIGSFSKLLSINSNVVIIDPFDELFQLRPNMPEFNQHLISHRKILSPNSATRDTKNFIEQEMSEFGFKLDKQIYYYVPSSLPDYKQKYYEYMKATSEIIGCTQNVLDEIEEWFQDSNAFAQIGLYMYNFIKSE